MWFDARAALARIESEPDLATTAPAQFAGFAGFATPAPLKPKTSPSSPAPITEAAGRRSAALPRAPATCARCGGADWQVALAESDGRQFHVGCWQAEVNSQNAMKTKR